VETFATIAYFLNSQTISFNAVPRLSLVKPSWKETGRFCSIYPHLGNRLDFPSPYRCTPYLSSWCRNHSIVLLGFPSSCL